MDVKADIDPETVAPNHPESYIKLKKQHLGVGSFKRGRIFAPITKHRVPSYKCGYLVKHKQTRRKEMKSELKSQLEYITL